MFCPMRHMKISHNKIMQVGDGLKFVVQQAWDTKAVYLL